MISHFLIYSKIYGSHSTSVVLVEWVEYEALLWDLMNCSSLNSALISRLNLEIIWPGGVKLLFQKIFQAEILVLFVTE